VVVRLRTRRCNIRPFFLTLELLGALGVFLLGMKLMSEALQRAAGNQLKRWLGLMTANRFAGVLSGIAITSVLQSSSATTVMVVSFVSAGLLSLTQAIGVIMGANIGTTMTGWIVSLLGFKVSIGAFALPAVGIGTILGFMRGERKKQWGEVLLGFGLLFLGIGLLKDSVPELSQDQLGFVRGLGDHGFGSVLIFVGVGTVLTVILQSSSATMTLTLTMSAMGWLPYESAVAMILGENIGTTATANLAAIGMPVDARRAARVHLLFNLFGVIWALALFNVYLLPLADAIVPGDPHVNGAGAAGVITTHLAAIHTIFNLTNTVILLPAVQLLARLVTAWVPDKKQERPSRLVFLSPAGIETPEILLVQAGEEMRHMTDEVRQMFADAMKILTHPEEKLGPLVEKTLHQEQVVDDLEEQISAILTDSTSAGTSPSTARRIGEMIQNTHRLERIGDHCAVLVRIARRTRESGHVFAEADVADLAALGKLVDQALENLGAYLAGDQKAAARAEEIERSIDELRRTLREKHIEQLKVLSGDQIRPQLGLLDMLTHLEEVGDRAVGIIRLSERTRLAA